MYCTLILTKKYFLQLTRITMEYLCGFYRITLIVSFCRDVTQANVWGNLQTETRDRPVFPLPSHLLQCIFLLWRSSLSAWSFDGFSACVCTCWNPFSLLLYSALCITCQNWTSICFAVPAGEHWGMPKVINCL